MKNTILLALILTLTGSAFAADNTTIGGKFGLDFYNNKDGKGTPSFETGKVLYADQDSKTIVAGAIKFNANTNYKLAVYATNANIKTEGNLFGTGVSFIPFIGLENTRSESTLNNEVKHYTDNYIVFGTVATLPYNLTASGEIKGGLDSYRIETSIDYKINKAFGISTTIGQTNFHNASKDFKNQSDVNIGLSFQF